MDEEKKSRSLGSSAKIAAAFVLVLVVLVVLVVMCDKVFFSFSGK